MIMTKSSHSEIVKELTESISEIIYMDSHSVENVVSATLSPNHLNGDSEEQSSIHTITFWNVVKEKWQNVLLSDIVSIERLTNTEKQQKQWNVEKEIIKILEC